MNKIITEPGLQNGSRPTKSSGCSNHSSDYPQEIRVGHATIRLLSIESIEVDDSLEGDREPFFQYGPYFVDDTRALDPIRRVLENVDWSELELNDAVKQCQQEDQFHPPESEYVNQHAGCLHLWKQTGQTFPLPPSILVGLKP